ncbi:sugar O-acetyltransferase [Brenneria populi subsp. brevivirga]|nr:sugar O-acetyltransferase [Brenneria populi subsp. brevivirga]
MREMNELTGVIDGFLYDANNDEALIHLRRKAKSLCFKYNQTMPESEGERFSLLGELLGKCGRSITVEPPFYCDYGTNTFIGDHFYANHNLVILDGARVTIGNNVFIAPNVGIHTAGHPLDVGRRNQGLEYALPIVIGNNVWIGASAVILPGVSIGDGAMIGAGSVVTKDIPANVIAVGNPCRVLREISDRESERQNFS